MCNFKRKNCGKFDHLSGILFTIYQYEGFVVFYFYMVDWLYWDREDKCVGFWTFVQFLFLPQGVANSLLLNLNENK